MRLNMKATSLTNNTTNIPTATRTALDTTRRTFAPIMAAMIGATSVPPLTEGEIVNADVAAIGILPTVAEVEVGEASAVVMQTAGDEVGASLPTGA